MSIDTNRRWCVFLSSSAFSLDVYFVVSCYLYVASFCWLFHFFLYHHHLTKVFFKQDLLDKRAERRKKKSEIHLMDSSVCSILTSLYFWLNHDIWKFNVRHYFFDKIFKFTALFASQRNFLQFKETAFPAECARCMCF